MPKPPAKDNCEVIAVRLSKEEKDKLFNISSEEDITVSQIIRKLVRDYLRRK